MLRNNSILQLQEQSVDDLLKLWEGEKNKITSGEQHQLKLVELASWFTGPGRDDPAKVSSWLHRGNVEEWIAHYWFRGSTPEELESRPGEYKELNQLVDMVLVSAGLAGLPQGRNPDIRPFRIFTDPLPVLHRPLFMYVGTSLLCPLMTFQVMRMMGFRRERVGALCYWHRPPRSDVPASIDIAGPRQLPLVFVHGLGVGLVPYYMFIHRLSQRYSNHLYVPEFPFLAMAPWESVPSAREVVAQLQDMLAANGHTAAHFAGHSFGAVIIGWMMRMSRSSVVCSTLMEPAMFLLMKSDMLTKVIYMPPKSCYEMLLRYFVFRELFTVNLLCRNFFWEQSTTWPEDLHVPVVVQLAEDDAIVQSFFVRRLLEHERAVRKQRRKEVKRGPMPLSGSSIDVRAEPRQHGHRFIDLQWCPDFFHGQILGSRKDSEKLFGKMRQMVQTLYEDVDR